MHGDGESCPKKDCEPTCINCGGPHKASNYSCLEYILQRRTREISAHENIPLFEAASRIRGRSKNISLKNIFLHIIASSPNSLLLPRPLVNVLALPPLIFSLKFCPLPLLNRIILQRVAPHLLPSPLILLTFWPPCQELSLNLNINLLLHNQNHVIIITTTIGSFSRVLVRGWLALGRELALILFLLLLLHPYIRMARLLRLSLVTGLPSGRDLIPLHFYYLFSAPLA